MRCRLLLVALLSLALVAPAGAPALGASGDAGSAVAAAKKKAKKKRCKTKKVHGKRKKVCKKKGAKVKPKPKPPVPNPPLPNPPLPNPPLPNPPVPNPPVPNPPVDIEQYRADDVGRQAIAQGAFLERSTGGAFPVYTRIFLYADGRLRISTVEWNVVMGEKCTDTVDGAWSFDKAYKPPEGGLLIVLNLQSPTINGPQVFWAVSDTVVKVGKDLVDYSINPNMADSC
ncbi:MAG TPA: hypothetical protein VF533_00440 [Solirubrobacteraceae bacterium]|jgi:hypothetical protein